MSKASGNTPSFEPQSSETSVQPTRNFSRRVNDRVSAIRSILYADSCRGMGAGIADRMGWRRERISRELQGTEKLSLDLFLASLELHREEGRSDVAHRLMAVINSGQPVLSSNGAVVIRMSDGQLFLDLQ